MVSYSLEPDYRFSNCNIQAPKIKAGEIQSNKISFQSFQNSGIRYEDRKLPMAKIFNIQPELYNSSNVSSELTLYLKNQALSKTSVVQIIAVKCANSWTDVNSSIVNYQTVGPIKVTNIYPLTSNTLEITVDTSCDCYWVCRGI